MSAAQNERQTICTLRCGGALYGVPAVAVCEVLEWRPSAPVPLAPEFVAGVIVYQGDVLTVIRLSSILDPSEPRTEAAIVVLEDLTTAERFALTVDSVEQVISVSNAEVQANPTSLGQRLQTLLNGVLSPESGDPLILLDVSRLAPDSLLQELERPTEASTEGEPCVL